MYVTIRIHFKLFRQIPVCGPLSNKFHHNARDIVGGDSHYVFISCTLCIIKSSQGQFTDRLLTVLNFVLVRLIVIDFIKVFNYWTPSVNRRGFFITQNKLEIARFCHKKFMNTGPTDGERPDCAVCSDLYDLVCMKQ